MSEENILDKAEEIDDDYLKLKQTGQKLVEIRKNPLLLLYYNEACGKIQPFDVEILEDTLESLDNVNELDLIIYTKGGDVNTSYKLAQLVRTKCKKLNIMVPYYAYSGGTLICLSSNKILMRPGISSLSPIDVQLYTEDSHFALINFDKFIEFVYDTSHAFDFKDETNKTHYITKIMENLTTSIGAINIGEFYRLRRLQEIYARTLLKNHMFENEQSKEEISTEIIKKLTSECPSHDFEIDYCLAVQFGLKVDKFDDEIYFLSKNLIESCKDVENKGIICKHTSSDSVYKFPFFKLFNVIKK